MIREFHPLRMMQLLQQLLHFFFSLILQSMTTIQWSHDRLQVLVYVASNTVPKAFCVPFWPRQTTVADFQKMDFVAFSVETEKILSHTPRTLTPGERRSMMKKRQEAHATMVPQVFEVLKSIPRGLNTFSATCDRVETLFVCSIGMLYTSLWWHYALRIGLGLSTRERVLVKTLNFWSPH